MQNPFFVIQTCYMDRANRIVNLSAIIEVSFFSRHVYFSGEAEAEHTEHDMAKNYEGR